MSLPLVEHIEKDGFRLRGVEVSRVDAFSDVVFGFALTLLVVSLQVPKTFAELRTMLGGFVPFAVSFTLLTLIWFAHYKFFRRTGLHDVGTVAINAMLLFTVLFYVYPLKFLFTFLTALLMGVSGRMFFASSEEIRQLMELYGAGFAGIYLLFAALYWNAWRQRERLGLTALERILLKGYGVDMLGTASVGVMSCVLARLLPVGMAGMSGWAYILIWVAGRLTGRWTRRRVGVLQQREAEEALRGANAEVSDAGGA